jgi:hypothetical protein
MRGMIGDKHPSVNLPPLPLPTRAEGEGGGSGVDSGDGFLVVGRDFNRARFDPVANSKFLDDRPWGAVDAFARKLVLGEVCLSSLVAPVDGTVDGTAEISGAGGECTTSPVDEQTRTPRLDPAAPCDGEGVDPSGLRLRDAPPLKPRKTPRHTYRFSVRYYGPGFKGWAWSADDEKYFAPSKRNDDDESLFTPDGGIGRALVSRRVQRLRGDAEGARASVRERHDKNQTSLVRGADGQGRARLGADGFVRRGERFKRLKRVSRNRQATRRGVSGGSSRAPARRGDARASRDAQELPRDVLRHLASVRVRVSHEAEHARRADPRANDKRRAAERNAGKARRALASVGGRRRDIRPSVSASKKKGVDCYAFARDTVPGKDSFVKFLEARAFLGRVPTPSDDARTDSTKERARRRRRDRARRRSVSA